MSALPAFKEIVDLSMPMKSMHTPVYPGYPQPLRTTFSTLRDNGYQSYVWSFVEHTATHVDAPVHMVEGGTAVDKMPLTRYVGRGLALDFSGRPRYQIQRADVERAVKEAAAGGERTTGADGGAVVVGKGWFLLFYTGYSAKGETKEWLDHPDLTKDACDYIVDLGVEGVGMDAPGPDHPPFEAHRTLLPKSVVIYENLDNIDKLLGKQFIFVGTPIAFVGGTAGVTRPVGLVI